jgi:bifunctional DNA-binding transcriptional regulator/antitoxin component of YhaV-PrlF toxin-antitoxin module
MNTNIVAKVTAEGKLEIPPEILIKLQPLTEYEVSVTETEIVFKKITQPNVDLDKFLQDLEDLPPEPNQPTLEEISEMVKEMRRERR